jgi:hypothetical protein
MMNKNASEKDYAMLKDIATFYKPIGIHVITDRINKFLSLNGLSIDDIDIVINGRNGDVQNDKVYGQLEENIFSGKTNISYKQWSGEFPTSSGYALWLAANIAKHQQLPAGATTDKAVKQILIYNHYQNIHHSLQLVTAC